STALIAASPARLGVLVRRSRRPEPLRPVPRGSRAETLRRDLRAANVDGAAFSVMLGAGEWYFSAFALALWAGDRSAEVTAGLLAAVSLYFGAGFASAPAWTTWIERLVPRRIFAAYFARRSLVCQAATLVTVLACGAALDRGQQSGVALTVFAAMFALAGAGR